MVMKVFILGRPGSGKSSAARHILKLARRGKIPAIRVNDYDILYKMSCSSSHAAQFRPTDEYNGFDVVDFSVLNTALKKAETTVRKKIRSHKIVIIEFARDDYYQALNNFGRSFLKNAYFLFIDTDMDTCKKRIRHRTLHPSTPDDHFVSETILNNYYKDQDFPSADKLQQLYSVDKNRVFFLNNRGVDKRTKRSFEMRIAHTFNAILQEERLNTFSRRIKQHVSANFHRIAKNFRPRPRRNALPHAQNALPITGL